MVFRITDFCTFVVGLRTLYQNSKGILCGNKHLE
mgnify:CR=1 FL=1